MRSYLYTFSGSNYLKYTAKLPGTLRLKSFFYGCALLAIVGCSSGSDSGSDPNTEPTLQLPDQIAVEQAPGMPALYTVKLTKSDTDAISIDSIRYLPAREGLYRPLTNIAGSYLALAYAGNELVEVVAVEFPDSLIAEDFGEDLQVTSQSVESLARTSAIVHFDGTSPVDRIEVQDSTGLIVAISTELPARDASMGRGSWPLANYPWLELLDSDDISLFPNSEQVTNLFTPTAGDISKIESALDRMPRRLVSAIDTIGIGSLSTSGLATGALVLLDSKLMFESDALLQHTLLHESGHAFHNASAALGSATFDEWATNWPAGFIAELRKTHEQFGLDKDLLTFWYQLHLKSVSAALSLPYLGSNIALEDPFNKGFVSGYAGTNLADDIADTVAAANLRITRSVQASASSRACTHYQATDELRRQDALAYLKIRLVQAFQLAKAEDVDWCLGDAVPVQDNGIHLGDALLFNDQLKAGYTGSDRQQFNIVGQDNENRGFAIELQTEGKRPEGVYPLDFTWWGAWDGSNTLVISSTKDIEARTGAGGVVVVTYADSTDRVDGFVFDLTLFSAFGPASRFDFVPFRIPLR